MTKQNLWSNRYTMKLGQIGSNLIVRIPTEVSAYMELNKGNKMRFWIKNRNEIILEKVDK